MSEQGAKQLSELTELRKLRLRREETMRQSAREKVAQAQHAHQCAVMAVDEADVEYKTKVAHTYERLSRGGVSAMSLVGALRDCDVTKEKVTQLNRVVDVRVKDVDKAHVVLSDAQARVRKAEMKIDVSKTLHEKQIAAINVSREIIMEDETDEIVLLRRRAVSV
jgi:hypothetical protein